MNRAQAIERALRDIVNGYADRGVVSALPLPALQQSRRDIAEAMLALDMPVDQEQPPRLRLLCVVAAVGELPELGDEKGALLRRAAPGELLRDASYIRISGLTDSECRALGAAFLSDVALVIQETNP